MQIDFNNNLVFNASVGEFRVNSSDQEGSSKMSALAELASIYHKDKSAFEAFLDELRVNLSEQEISSKMAVVRAELANLDNAIFDLLFEHKSKVAKLKLLLQLAEDTNISDKLDAVNSYESEFKNKFGELLSADEPGFLEYLFIPEFKDYYIPIPMPPETEKSPEPKPDKK